MKCSIPQIRMIIPSLIAITILNTCWDDDRQDNPVTPPVIPRYTLSGHIMNQKGLGLAGLTIILVMQEVYHGEFVEEPYCATTAVQGAYSFPNLYRGRYNFVARDNGVELYNKDIGMINYADRELDITVEYP